MRSLSYLSKMIIFAFLLGTLPVIFIGVFAYATSAGELKRHVSEGKMQLLKQTNANVEQVLTTVNHALNQFVNSTVFNSALHRQLDADDFQLYNNLRNELRFIQSFDTKVSDVVIINERYDWMIKNSGLYRFSEYVHHEPLAKLIDAAEGTVWMLNPSFWFYSEENASSVDCHYTISLVKKLPQGSLEHFGLALANIPTCSLQSVLQYDVDELEQVMILDDRFRVLLHPDRNRIGSVFDLFPPERLQGASGQFNTEIGGKPYAVSYHRSDFNGWIYVSIVSLGHLTRQSGKIGMYTLVVCLVMLLVSLAVAWFGSRRMYSPIERLLRQISDRWPDGQRGKNVDEFQIIRQRLNDLFQSKSHLERELRRHLSQVVVFWLVRAFQGNVKPSEIRERLEQYGFGQRVAAWRHMVVIAVQIGTLENTRYSQNDIDLLQFAIHNMIQELVPDDQHLPPTLIEQTTAVLIGSPTEDAEEFAGQIYALTERLQQSIASFLQLQVSIGISLPFDRLENLSRAWRESQEALRHRIKLGDGVIIRYANVNSGKHYLNLNYPHQIENDLVDAIKLADKERARKCIKAFLDAVFSVELSPQEYQIPLARLLNNLLIVMQESGISLNQIHKGGSSLYEQLFRLQVVPEIEAWFRTAVVEPMIDIFAARQMEQYQNISEKIIDLIRRYYDTDLTLEQCAAKLHYNANYLSSVFRKETNCSFSEYLSAYRFNMAKKWLAETDMPIKEIAARLRYNNPQNFIRSFRKQEGITPGQYREKYQRHLS